MKSALPALALSLCACATSESSRAQSTETRPSSNSSLERGRSLPDAKTFVAQVNRQLKDLSTRAQRADWTKATYITEDTEATSAAMNEALLAYSTQAIKDSTRYVKDGLDPDTARMLLLLRVGATAAPSDPARRLELTTLAARLDGHYGRAKACDAQGTCRDLEQLSDVLRDGRNDAELYAAWAGWHDTAAETRKDYQRFVELANEGAREIGFANLGDQWRAGYDMSPAGFEAETDRLWGQVKPLYDDLHCYVRATLQKTYGEEKVPARGPIPAHLLGNMWAQEWTNVYPLVEPYKGVANLDVSAAIQKQGWDALKMVKTAEGFFTSLGLDPLPKTFWERSLFVKPAEEKSPFRAKAVHEREVVCHASAWDVDSSGDLRVKLCLKPQEEDLVTLHHELGHLYYDHAYDPLPFLYEAGANDGFHEAIGDALTLSMTPAYYQQLGLLSSLPKDSDKARINLQLKDALSKVAFLPFAKLVDQWRWDVFSGKTSPADYNKAWWALRQKYQGVAPAQPRGEDKFDAGAKYHVASNTPYTRYFLARILQFQFYRAMCKAAGVQGPLYECNFYGNKQAGAALQRMLKLGASKPWPDALEAISGERQMDGTALLEYFAPLRGWLKEQNRGRQCGW